MVAPSRRLMNAARDSMLAPAMVSARVIPHGIDLSIFRAGDKDKARAALGLPPDAAILLFASKGVRNNIWKDYQTMRRAFEILGARFGNKRLLFLALGETAPAAAHRSRRTALHRPFKRPATGGKLLSS